MKILIIFTFYLISGQIFILIFIFSYIHFLDCENIKRSVTSQSMIFFWLTGAVDCSDVVGYSGGSVIIISNIQWYTHNSKYICKVKGNDCTDIIRADTKRSKVQDGRFMLYANTAHQFLVLIRKLKSQDAGTYRFGLGDQSNTTVNLKVFNSK